MKRQCLTWFAPAVTARGHQRVCGAGSKRRRRNKLARRRRPDDLEAQRADERGRQEKHRDGRGRDRHEPPSGRTADVDAALAQAARFGALEVASVERILARCRRPRTLDEYVAEETAKRIDDALGPGVTTPGDLGEYDAD